MPSTADHAGVRFPPPLLFAAGFLIGWLLHRAWPLWLLPDVGSPRHFVAGLLVGIGGALAVWGIATFRRARTAVIPHYPASRIVAEGPYRFTRNPMYVGLTLVYAGAALGIGMLWPLVLLPVVLIALTYLVIRREEAYLQRAFGDDYAAYRARVRRWV